MTGKFIIDGKDAYLNYGVMVVQAGYNELAGFASLKNVQSNEWQEEDGGLPIFVAYIVGTHIKKRNKWGLNITTSRSRNRLSN